ncbi:Uu.00g074610.m01.CDS01 [Anthostomella pinea]|uniref:Uu.00g074610.m01.CDS01 n=1 Tax=Anthostomella pinea TaxID=933095 RepID=A0AAI8VVI5_9PEZI|nr:Uu.00g074610.m01.CDS01 [Anthostomella pinea]
MASTEVDARHSHKLSGDSGTTTSSGSGQKRGRQSSAYSSVLSIPSCRSSAPTSTSSTLRDEYQSGDGLHFTVSGGSVDSIVDDPFFQQYDPADPRGAATTQPPVTAPLDERHDSSPTKLRSAPRKESQTINETDALPQTPSIMESINIAVIGANGVGKSHFIQRAMSLSRVPGPNPTTARIKIDNIPFAVTLFELDLEYFDVDPDRQIKWPKQMGGAMMPRINGVLLLYDVMNRDSIIELPQTLSALVNSSLPAVLVATKCDNPDNSRHIDTEAVAAACQSCLATFKTSANKPESARMSLSTLLKALVLRSQDAESTEVMGSRRRAASVAHLDAPSESTNPRPLSQQSKHSRASSDMSLLRGFSNQQGADYRQGSRSSRVDLMGGNIPDEDESAPTVSSQLRTPGIRLDRAQHTNSFLDMEDSDGETLRYSDEIPLLQRGDETVFERPAKKLGISFDELIDRLIAPKMSRADNNFADVFLCLYRKFASPGELFSAILSRLERVKDDKSIHYLTKTATQLRIIEVIARWVAAYPGDFARATTRKNLDDFIKHLSTEPIFAAAAQQMRRTFDSSVVEDDDTGWAKADVNEETQASQETASSARKDSTKTGTDFSESMSSLSVDGSVERRPSASSSLNTDAPAGGKTHSFQFHSYADYEREAATMVPTYTLPLTKFRYHIFMDTSNDDIADEMTRIDWVMLSSIRIRDLVRHVSLSAEQREKSKTTKNVNRMITHFNHIATWVSNMILMREKAKHRAQMLEKFMNIALKLRQLNNYNGLAAVLAGINGTAIHRLSQTRALVPADVQKRFARLVLLMGTQKSHFAYRLAWENSPLPRIPFMPLHRRDLVSAEEGSMTFVGPQGNRINWKKFEILGEVILPIMKSQGTPYPNLSKHDTARELILDCLMPTDEEDIYQRSIQVESSTGSSVDTGKKKFPWFAKS